MSDYTKPLPDIEDPSSAPFWAGTKDHKLMMQKCTKCGYHRLPPSIVCPECQTFGDEWVAVPPTGTLYSFGTYHRAFNSKFKEDVPYSVGYVHLDAGPTMIGVLVGDRDSFFVDAKVQAVFDAVTPEVTLVRWELIPGQTRST